ncbi:MAG: DNA polymerase Y family protein, partial [Pseudolabrys sp.]
MLSLWLHRLSTDRIARSRKAPHETSAPLVVTGKRGNVEVLTAVDDTARQLGLTSGHALVQARAMYSGIDVVAEDLEADATLLDSIADWCLRYTPLVACDMPDSLLLDVSGCAHLYGGERELIADLSGR